MSTNNFVAPCILYTSNDPLHFLSKYTIIAVNGYPASTPTYREFMCISNVYKKLWLVDISLRLFAVAVAVAVVVAVTIAVDVDVDVCVDVDVIVTALIAVIILMHICWLSK
uniref:Transmembrane protein n=1 Tax=Glossina brevipalpis TaxID=37001 RepID=A0A1A9W9G5_9MUSC